MLREDSTRRLVVFVLVGLCAISLRLGWGVSGEFPINFGTAAFAQEGGCEPVTDIRGRGNQESEPFNIVGETFRVVFEADNPGDTPGYAFFNVIDDNGGIVQPESQDISEDDPDRIEGSATFSSGPGSYTVEIASEEAEYTIAVEDCGADTPQDPNPSREPRNEPRDEPRSEPNDQRDTEYRQLLRAGGPEDGPVPPMPGGSCPEEYPFQSDDVCYG